MILILRDCTVFVSVDDDCGDNSDEAGCVHSCANGQYKCTSGRCIPDHWACDGDNDCGDFSDEMWLVLVLPLVGHHISLFVFVFAYILCFVFSFGMDHVAVIFGWYAHYASDILHIMLEFIFWTASSVSTIFKFKNVSIFKNLYEGPHILFICAPSRFGYIRFNFIVIMQNREPVKYTVVSI